MECGGKVYIVHGSKPDRFRIHFLADIHDGAKNCARKRALADIRAIAADPYAFAILGGDYGEYIHWLDKRFDGRATDLTPEQLDDMAAVMQERLLALFGPLKSKILGAHVGNHESAFMRHAAQGGMHARFCKALGVPNLGATAFTDAVFMRRSDVKVPFLTRDIRKARPGGERQACQCQTFRIVSCHGRSGACTTSGKLTVLRKFMERFAGDLFFMGHLHERIAHRKTRIGANDPCTDLCDSVQVGVITGSYLLTYTKGQSGYGEEKQYDPVATGCASIEVKPATRELRAEV
jgi:hypothetical protein